MNPQAPADYTTEDTIRRIKTGPHVVVIQPERNMEVAVEIEVHDIEPPYIRAEWDHIVEASLHLPSGQLQVYEGSGGPVADLELFPGWYRVRSFHGNFDTIDDTGLDGDDFYRIVLFPAASADVRVIKQFGSFHPVNYVADFSHDDLDHSRWIKAANLPVASCWAGTYCRAGLHFQTRLLWSDAFLYVRFDATQRGQPVVADKPITAVKTIGLWQRDVCEIFIAPDRCEPRKYFEFEVAPTGEWLDLAIDLTSGERVTDWDYNSGMEVAARIEDGRLLMAMKIPWEAFGKRPESGDVWLGNIFRCVGREPDRGYLAWQPTMTEKPDFHVPEAFGEFHFVE